MSDDTPFSWKQEALRVLIAAVITSVVTMAPKRKLAIAGFFIACASSIGATENISIKDTVFDENQIYANGEFGDITAQKCVFNASFAIGQNRAVNNITLDSCIFNGITYIFTNGSITKLTIKDCTFNGALNIVNNTNITGMVEIVGCTINENTKNNVFSDNNFFNVFRFTKNTVRGTMKMTLNKFEGSASFRDNEFNRFAFDLDTLNSIAVFTGNTYAEDAVFNSSFFHALAVFNGETINNKMGFVESYFNARAKFTNLYKTSDGVSSLNFDDCNFGGRLDISGVSNRVQLFNLYSNSYGDFYIDFNLLKNNINNIAIRKIESAKVVDIAVIKNKREEMSTEHLARYRGFLSYMVRNYRGFSMNKEAAAVEAIRIRHTFDMMGPVEHFLSESWYIISFNYFQNYFGALLYAVFVIVVFMSVYAVIILRLERKGGKKIPARVWLEIFGEAFLHSVNVFFNLSYNKTILLRNVPGPMKLVEALLGIYFIVFIAMVVGNVLL
ncbi:MAG: hypothetical protein LBK83_02350 [Treponema sp.]|jgi:hypothetical protein|nr:hypothetical protein [Treponema sp.]